MSIRNNEPLPAWEVFVTESGAETDLDLNYTFTDTSMSKQQYITASSLQATVKASVSQNVARAIPLDNQKHSAGL